MNMHAIEAQGLFTFDLLPNQSTLDIDSDNVGSCIFVQDCALGDESKYGRPFEN